MKIYPIVMSLAALILFVMILFMLNNIFVTAAASAVLLTALITLKDSIK